jgi:hypothetical protein
MPAATKDDLTFDRVNKRVQVPAAFDEVTVQVLVDGIRQQEDELDYLDAPRLMSAVGKDPLGGGESTIITLTLEDGWQLEFQGGAGSVYRVTAGNLIATDELGADSEPVYTAPTTKTVVLANATTGSINETTVQHVLDYAEGVFQDGDDGVPIPAAVVASGDFWPYGTLAQPVDNFPDATLIAEAFNTKVIHVLPTTSGATQTLDCDISGYIIDSPNATSHLDLAVGNDVTDTRFIRCHLTGAANATRHWFADHCHLAEGAPLSGLVGVFEECLIDGEVTITGSATFFHCASGVAGFGTATVDAPTGDHTLQFRSYAGGLTVKGITAGDFVSLDMMPGRVILDSTVTGGDIKIRGIGEPLEDNSVGATIDSDGFIVADDVEITRKILQNRSIVDQGSGLMTIVDDDDLTTLLTATIWEDSAGTVAYQGQGIERRDRLT